MPIPDIHNAETLKQIEQRINVLSPATQRHWGTMNVAQMMAHCNAAIQMQLGETSIKAPFIMRLIGPMIKNKIASEKPFDQNLPTDKSFIVAGPKEFEYEKQGLLAAVTRLCQSDVSIFENRKHPLFGKMTVDEWKRFVYKHIDHHLRQFGV